VQRVAASTVRELRGAEPGVPNIIHDEESRLVRRVAKLDPDTTFRIDQLNPLRLDYIDRTTVALHLVECSTGYERQHEQKHDLGPEHSASKAVGRRFHHPSHE
jgi:hypothetical protein